LSGGFNLAPKKTVRQQKDDAQALISKLYMLPILPKPAEILAKGLVELDPLGFFQEPQPYTTPVYPGPTRAPTILPDPVEAVTEVINNPEITVTPALVKVINDPKKVIDRTGEIVTLTKAQLEARARMLNPIQAAPLYPPVNIKRTRRKTKTDRTMSSCLKEANAKARKKNGSMKKGWSQAKIMKEAHRMCRKKMGTRKGMVRKTARRAYER